MLPKRAVAQAGRWWGGLTVNCNAWSRFPQLLGTAEVRYSDFVAVLETHLDALRTRDVQGQLRRLGWVSEAAPAINAGPGRQGSGGLVHM
eukprot:5547344-Pyramimonas_sp.AAC.1